MNAWLAKAAFLTVATAGSLLVSQPAQARKLHVSWGYFLVNVKTSSATDSINNVGVTNVSYHEPILPRVELVANYTLIMSNVIGGDLAFGLGFGFMYYPFSENEVMVVDTSKVKMTSEELWRPYIGTTFQERRFQSVGANYAGFGLTVGTERKLEYYNLTGIGELRISQLIGSKQAEATEFVLTMGLSLPF